MLLTLEAWLPHVRRYRLIGTFRHPQAVARSLYERNDIPIDQGVRLWVHYNRCLVDLHRGDGFPLIHFGVNSDEYLSCVRSLCRKLDLRYDQNVAAFFEPQLLSHHHDHENVCQAEAGELYRYLLDHQLQPAETS